MAGDWMKVEKVTPDKPEIDAIASKLALDPDAVFGKCFRIWRWFDDHTVKGNAPRVTKNSLDRRVGVDGFADAMAEEGWLVIDGDGVTLPNFDRHCGETSKQRALTAKRVAKQKADANAKGNAKGNAKVTDEALPREEKRREESSPSSPPPPARRGGDSPSSQAWKGVEEDLRKAGVRLAPDAVAHARSAGCSADDVTDVICFWRLHAGAWDAGALYQRVKNLAPGQDCSELWPDKLPTYQAAKRREDSAKAHASVVSTRIDAEKKKAADEKRLAELEEMFGQKIDAMTNEQVRAAIVAAEPGAAGSFMLSRYRGGRPSGTIREALLNHLSEVPKGPTLFSETL